MLVNLWLLGMSVLALVNALRALQLNRRLRQVTEWYKEADNEARYWFDFYDQTVNGDQEEAPCHE